MTKRVRDTALQALYAYGKTTRGDMAHALRCKNDSKIVYYAQTILNIASAIKSLLVAKCDD